MWKVILDSIEGTSHKREQCGCQDSSACVELSTASGSILCLICSDGAGSAKNAAEASAYTCQRILSLLTSHLASGVELGELNKELLLSWINDVRAELSARAKATQVDLSEYACTLVLVAVSDTECVCAQIGDGAIVISLDGKYTTVFWPDSGEYANTTFFVTSPSIESRLHFTRSDSRVDELALFTDGLQMLSLDYSRHQVHQPFFRPMFESMRAETQPDALVPLLSQFLQSDKVSARTADDKTLILALREGSERS